MSITNGHWKKQDNSARAGESRWSQGSGKPYQNRIKTPSGSTESCARLWKAFDRSSAGHLSGWARFATSRNQHETRIGADLSKFTRIEPQCPGTGPPGGGCEKGISQQLSRTPLCRSGHHNPAIGFSTRSRQWGRTGTIRVVAAARQDIPKRRGEQRPRSFRP